MILTLENFIMKAQNSLKGIDTILIEYGTCQSATQILTLINNAALLMKLIVYFSKKTILI